MIGTEHTRAATDATDLARRYGLFISVRVSNLPPVVVVADVIVRQVGATHTTHLGGFTPRMKTGGMELVVASHWREVSTKWFQANRAVRCILITGQGMTRTLINTNIYKEKALICTK